MKVVGVSCSARVDRNTADLLNLSLETLREKGLETELTQLANYKILPCQRCDYQCLYHKDARAISVKPYHLLAEQVHSILWR